MKKNWNLEKKWNSFGFRIDTFLWIKDWYIIHLCPPFLGRDCMEELMECSLSTSFFSFSLAAARPSSVSLLCMSCWMSISKWRRASCSCCSRIWSILSKVIDPPKACSFPQWKSSSSCSNPCSMVRTSATSVRNVCSLHDRPVLPESVSFLSDFLDFFSGFLDDAGYTSSLMIVAAASILFGIERLYELHGAEISSHEE